MRKMFALAMVAMLALTLAFSLVGCAKKAEETPATETTPPAESTMPSDSTMHSDSMMSDTTHH